MDHYRRHVNRTTGGGTDPVVQFQTGVDISSCRRARYTIAKRERRSVEREAARATSRASDDPALAAQTNNIVVRRWNMQAVSIRELSRVEWEAARATPQDDAALAAPTHDTAARRWETQTAVTRECSHVEREASLGAVGLPNDTSRAVQTKDPTARRR